MTVTFDKAITLARCFKSGAIEWPMAPSESAKEPIKEEKTDAKIGVHAAVFVHGVMMNVVQAARGKKPTAKERLPRHPKVGEVHTVVQVIKGKDGPADKHGYRKELIERRYVEEKQDQPDDAQ